MTAQWICPKCGQKSGDEINWHQTMQHPMWHSYIICHNCKRFFMITELDYDDLIAHGCELP